MLVTTSPCSVSGELLLTDLCVAVGTDSSTVSFWRSKYFFSRIRDERFELYLRIWAFFEEKEDLVLGIRWRKDPYAASLTIWKPTVRRSAMNFSHEPAKAILVPVHVVAPYTS